MTRTVAGSLALSGRAPRASHPYKGTLRRLLISRGDDIGRSVSPAIHRLGPQRRYERRGPTA